MRYLVTALSLILILGTTGCKDSKADNKKTAEDPGSQTITFESGDTFVTEFVPGITSEEERTDESFNVKDYLTSSISGTWATASMGYEYKGEFLPEYHVRFTDSEVNYGHIIDGVFEPDHSNKIVSLQEIGPGRYRIQAQTSSGGQYTYQTDENDTGILNYYETWNESDFPDAYRGGSSLTRID